MVSLPFFLCQTLQSPPCFRVFAEPRHIKRWVAPTLKILKNRRDQIGPEPPSPRSSYLEFNYDAEIFAFGKRLGEEFNEDLLRQALIQKSYVNKMKDSENPDQSIKDNSELEEEGGRFISEYIKEQFSGKYATEIVNSLHQYLTTESMLSHVALHIGLKDIVLTAVSTFYSHSNIQVQG